MAEENKEKSTDTDIDSMLIEDPEEDNRKELEAETNQIIANMQKSGSA